MSMAPEGGFASLGDSAGVSGRNATKAAPRAGLGWTYLQKAERDSGTEAETEAGAVAGTAEGSAAAAAPRSLTELVQRELAVKSGSAPAKPAERRPFDREKDLVIPRQANTGAIIAQSAALHGKFRSGRGWMWRELGRISNLSLSLPMMLFLINFWFALLFFVCLWKVFD
jgi:hypothetical protein